MQTHVSFPAESICTCGYLTQVREGLHLHEHSDFTRQIGYLLIGLGSIFDAAPAFKMYLNPGTAKLLISIGHKLVRSVQSGSRMDC